VNSENFTNFLGKKRLTFSIMKLRGGKKKLGNNGGLLLKITLEGELS
jgi:hypothetical protein